MCQPDSSRIIAKIAAAVLLIAIASSAQQSQAQEKIVPVTVSSVSSRASANGTVVSIDASGPLNRAQTWQDRDGYHVVVPAAGTQNAIKVGKGIKVHQLDRSIEIVIQTQPGANVTVQPMANRLNLNVEGKLDPRSTENESAKSDKRVEDDFATQPDASKTSRLLKGNSSLNDAPASGSNPSDSATAAKPAVSGQGAPSETQPAMGESSVMSDTTVLVVIGVVCIGGLLLVRRWKNAQSAPVAPADNDGFDDFSDLEELNELTLDGLQPKSPGAQSNNLALQRKSPGRLPAVMPSALYGAYQVDLEIAKLVQGQPHRMDVVASRAPDDRRAIEASLLKSINPAIGDEEMQRRARIALEEYGFVARQSAALLTSSDPYERTSAARMLGDVKSSTSLPFLLEALYDSESQVRNQAVLSIGELRLPSAIGALLDIARKHPDVPGALLSKALNACSLDGLDFFDSALPEPQAMSGVDARLLAEEIVKLEPASPTEELPDTVEDELLTKALNQVQSEVITDRAEAIKLLVHFQVKESVKALARLARGDSESSLRASAISALAAINHESVFPEVLVAMADESREVRAAAARSLSRLSFDRADAYIRLSRSNDVEFLRNVAEACVKAGIANQGIDRMTNGDHQAYESMSVVGLLAKAQSFEHLMSAVKNHPSMDVRLTIVYLLEMVGDASLVEPLRAIVQESISEEVSQALNEVISKLDPSQNDSQGNGEVEDYSAVEVQTESEPAPAAMYATDMPEEFETGYADTQFGVSAHREPEESDMATGFAFEFAPARQEKSDGEPNPSQFESSGRPAPPIA
jgi:HEAT repeat protein